MIKNKFILKSVSLFLSFWMLMASTGISVNFHYCDGEIVNWSILNDAEACDHKIEVKTCCEKEVVKKCHNPAEQELKKSSCCSSDQASIEIGNEYNQSESMAKITLPQFIILSQIVSSLSLDDEENIDRIIYEEPLLLHKLEPSFIQTFSI